MIVMISGKQGSGKTSTQKELMRIWDARGGESHEINFADVLYDMHGVVLEILHSYWPKRDIIKDGPLLQMLGTEWGRKTIDENIWVKILQTRLTKWPFCDPEALIIIGDCRFENEFDAIPEALRVRLECDREVRKKRCSMWRENDTHPSEIGLDNFASDGKFDLYINTDAVDVAGAATLIMAQLQKMYGEKSDEIERANKKIVDQAALWTWLSLLDNEPAE